MQKRKVLLTGELAKKFGREFHLAVSTPAEAVRALVANFPEFESFVRKSSDRNVGYKVIIANKMATENDELFLQGGGDIKIVPVIMGGKSGFLGIFAGIALIALSFICPATLALGTVLGQAITVSVASTVFNVGLSMVLGGIVSLLSPQPKAPKPAEAANNQPSYSFNGAVNTISQGQPVPVGYGRCLVGSAVISASLTSDNYSAAV